MKRKRGPIETFSVSVDASTKKRLNPRAEEKAKNASRLMGATYDTGMLIALDRRKERAQAVHEWLREEQIPISVPWLVSSNSGAAGPVAATRS